MVERQARDLEVRGSNPGPGSNFSLESKMSNLCRPIFQMRKYLVGRGNGWQSSVKLAQTATQIWVS